MYMGMKKTASCLVFAMDEEESMEMVAVAEARAQFDQFSEDVMEEILSRLPLRTSVVASAVCKRWHTLLRQGGYCRQLAARIFQHRPWFFLVGLNHFLPVKNQAFGYDPEANQYCRFPAFEMPPYDHGSLTGAHGLLFALTGSGICKLGYTRCLIDNSSWRETPPLLYSRRSPIAAMVTDPHSSTLDKNAGYHIVVAGGKSLDSQLVVEMYDPNANVWKQCAPLPPEFQFSSSSQWMHAAVFDGKFIAYETHTGCMAWLDLNQDQWSNAVLLRPMNPVYCFLVSCERSLVLVALYRESPRLKLWSVNLTTLQYTELGHMPNELFALFEEDDEEKDPLFTCVGGGDFIYIYSDSWHKDYLACVCDLSGGMVTWWKLPELPSPVNRFDKVVCFSSSIIPDSFL